MHFSFFAVRVKIDYDCKFNKKKVKNTCNNYREVLPGKFFHNVATSGSKPNGIYQNGVLFNINRLSLLYMKYFSSVIFRSSLEAKVLPSI